MYVGISYFLGADIARRIGNAGTKAVIGVVVIVVIGLVIRAGVAKWRATRQARREQPELPPPVKAAASD